MVADRLVEPAKSSGCAIVRTEKASGAHRNGRTELQVLLSFLGPGDALCESPVPSPHERHAPLSWSRQLRGARQIDIISDLAELWTLSLDNPCSILTIVRSEPARPPIATTSPEPEGVDI